MTLSSKAKISSRTFRFLAVVVLYKTSPADSITFQSLSIAVDEFHRAFGANAAACALLYDNTPAASSPAGLPSWVQYENAPVNRGLYAAYDRALHLAEANHLDWIILLDQDTHLPPDFLLKIGGIAEGIDGTPHVAAIVPQLTGDNKQLSPLWFRFGAFPSWFSKGFLGTPPQSVFAFNSGAVLRVSVLRQIGGFDPRFWLDYSDTRLFRQLAKYFKATFIAGNLQINHNFSMLDKQNRMSIDRYRTLLITESALWDLEFNRLAGLERTARLAMRLLKQFRSGEQKDFRNETARALGYRLFHSKRWRLRRWRQDLLQHCPGLEKELASRNASDRLKVSVCMATFNGAKYLGQQVDSILSQLQEQDELVIVDDGSTDGTHEIIANLGDPRIRLIEHSQNKGVVSSFEDALLNATGDILFLSDQDDIWANDRVEKTLSAFRRNPSAALVVTNTALIDEAGNRIQKDSRLQPHKFDARFLPNLISNRFQGSAMAFRSALLQQIFPFPKRSIFLHDAWIGARAALSRQQMIYLDEELLYYRRHGNNISGRLPVLLMFRKRLEMLGALISFSFRRHLR